MINGHYTRVLASALHAFPGTQAGQLDLGAIRLVREYGDLQKILGLNEDNITPFSGSKGTRTLKTDVLPIPATARTFGIPDPVHAEAWEFLLDGGGAFDHFGYIYDSDSGQRVRDQLGKIRAFLNGFPVYSLVTSKAPAPPAPAGAGWADVGDYPTASTWDEKTLSRKHWAAMETPGWQTATAGRKFLLYVHHSTPRCKADTDDFDRKPNPVTGQIEFKCGGQNLSLDAYDGRWRPTSKYQETDLKLHLGSKAGTFTVSWLDPTNPSTTPFAQEDIQWQGSPEACKGQSPCRVTSPRYPYDLVLRVVQKP
ncbi:MAG TPA: hypothetical protein VN783_05365 [Thermoanaerobaculia bacterium]|nr:hypothetical protein [Thermoanaerobaculia bacterium]